MALDAQICLDKRPKEIAVGILFDIFRVRNFGRTAIVFVVEIVPVTGSQIFKSRIDPAFGIDSAIPIERIGNIIRHMGTRIVSRIGIRRDNRSSPNRPDTDDTEISSRASGAFKLQPDRSDSCKGDILINHVAPTTLFELRPGNHKFINATRLGNFRFVIIVDEIPFIVGYELYRKFAGGLIFNHNAAPRRDIHAFLVFAPDVEAKTDIRIFIAFAENDGTLDAAISLNKRAEEVAVGIHFDIDRPNYLGRAAIVLVGVREPVTGSQIVRSRIDPAFGIDSAIPIERIGDSSRHINTRIGRNNSRIGRNNSRVGHNDCCIGPRGNHRIGIPRDRPDAGYTDVAARACGPFKHQPDSGGVRKNVIQARSLAPATLFELRPIKPIFSTRRCLGNSRLEIVIFGHDFLIFDLEFGIETKGGFISNHDSAPRRNIRAILFFVPNVETEACIRIIITIAKRHMGLDAAIPLDKRAVEIAVAILFDI